MAMKLRNKFKIGIVTMSDSAASGKRQSTSDKVIIKMIKKLGVIRAQSIIPDNEEVIMKELKKLVDKLKLDLIITTGGTGLSPRDVTPEATKKVIDKDVPGIAEALRFATFKTSPQAILSRAVTGVRKHSLIINLPGSPKAVKECLGVILPVLPHAIEIIKGKASRCGG